MMKFFYMGEDGSVSERAMSRLRGRISVDVNEAGFYFVVFAFSK